MHLEGGKKSRERRYELENPHFYNSSQEIKSNQAIST